MTLTLSPPLKNPEQHRICFVIRLEPALPIWIEAIGPQATTPLSSFGPVKMPLIGALAGLVALPLG
jgi:hypothetical protein